MAKAIVVRKSVGRKAVRVRVPPSALTNFRGERNVIRKVRFPLALTVGPRTGCDLPCIPSFADLPVQWPQCGLREWGGACGSGGDDL